MNYWIFFTIISLTKIRRIFRIISYQRNYSFLLMNSLGKIIILFTDWILNWYWMLIKFIINWWHFFKEFFGFSRCWSWSFFFNYIFIINNYFLWFTHFLYRSLTHIFKNRTLFYSKGWKLRYSRSNKRLFSCLSFILNRTIQ